MAWHQCGKRVKTKSRKVLRANSYVCKSYRGKSSRKGVASHPEYVILLSMSMILLYFNCDQVSDIWQQLELNLNLIHETLQAGVGRGLLIPILEKLSWFGLTSLITLFWKWCWGCLCFLNCTGVLTLSLLLKVPPRKFDPLFHEVSFSWVYSVSL